MSRVTELEKVKVCIDKIDAPSKPTPEEISLQNQRLANSRTEISVEDLAKLLVTHHSRMWVPAEFDGILSNDTWKSQQVIALDFKNKIKLEGVLERLNEYNLSCSFIYSKLSTTSKNFTVVFILKQIITNKGIRDHVMRACMMLFPEADMSCKDLIRVFPGGKKIIHQNYDYRLDIVHLVVSGELHYLGKASKNTLTKRLKELGEKCNSIICLIELQKNPKFNDIRDFDFNVAAETVKILDDFIKGQTLTQCQLWGICTNALHVTGGLKFVKKVMDRVGNYPKNYYNILPYVKWCGFYPMPLQGFSPYKEDHLYKDILTAIKIPRGWIRRTEPFLTDTLEEGEKKLKLVLNQVRAADDTKIHVIRASTGVGKTEEISNWDNVLIGFPDHKLKTEVMNRMKVDFQATPNIMDHLTENDKPFISHCYQVGAYHKASNYIYTKRKETQGYSLGPWEGEYSNYQTELAKSLASQGTVLTTHAKIKFANVRQKEIVFDEDPLTSLFLAMKTTSLSDIKSLMLGITDSADKGILASILELAIKSTINTLVELPDFAFNNYEAIENAAVYDRNIQGNVLDFLNCKHFLMDLDDKSKLNFINVHFPPEDKKVIILSATANEWIYKLLFGIRIEFYDLGPIELKGKLVQDTTYTFSQQNMLKPEVLKYATDRIEERMVITFQSCIAKFKNSYTDIYFGNCQGKDGYKNRPLAIIGTMHVNPATYVLYAKSLGLDFKPEDYRMGMRRVHHNGMDFNFFTFENELLRNLQFYFIERELRQAIGRARLIREENADVMLFSNYPLPEADQQNEIYH